jgi:DNA ligase-1
MSILQILDTIGAESSRTGKIALIAANQNNTLFREVLSKALNPYVNFYIKKIPDYSVKLLTEGESYKSLDWALTQLNKLEQRELTGHAGIDHLQHILESVSPEDSTVVGRIIGKDLRCGAADGTVNAAIPDFIPEYPCLLARPYDAKNIKNITYPAYSQLKADGLRANVIVKNGKVTLCGRSGRAIDLLGHMDADMLLLSAQYGVDMFYDGEFVVVDSSEEIVDRKTGNGIINKAIKGTIGDAEASKVRFQVWDAFPLSEFYARQSKETYDKRFPKLIAAIDVINKGEDALVNALKVGARKYRLIPFEIVNNLEEAEAHFQKLLSMGEEGTILKNYCGLWEDTRSKHLVKMKAEKDADMEIIGFNPGEGKFLGQVGSIQCASSDRLVEVNISGFSDELRLWITANQANLMGTIVTLMYNERIKSKTRTGVDSLFLPRFVEFRNDKKVANSTKEIK